MFVGLPLFATFKMGLHAGRVNSHLAIIADKAVRSRS